MRDYIEPAAIIASRVPEQLLNAAYGMRIKRDLDYTDKPDRPPTPHEMLCALCATKGYITNGTGRWDEFRACKEILRDFADGRILFVSPPPLSTSSMLSKQGAADLNDAMVATKEAGSEVDMVRWLLETEKVMVRREKVAERIAVQRLREIEEEEEKEKRRAAQPAGTADRGEMVFGDVRKGEEFMYYDDDDDDVEDEDEDEAMDEFNEDDIEVGGEGDGGHVDAAVEGLSTAMAGAGSTSRPRPTGGRSVNDASASGSTLTAWGVPKREHKRLKHWGKKNKKLRDKDPYGEDNGAVSYTAYSTNRALKADILSNDKVRRQDPRHTYGEQFDRASFPHHLQQQQQQQLQQTVPTHNVVNAEA
jgi:hypothetical protein